MRAVPHVATVALALWWAPTFAVAIAHAAPHVAAGLSAPYRMRRVRRLIDRGDVDEADRVIAALRREAAALIQWLDRNSLSMLSSSNNTLLWLHIRRLLALYLIIYKCKGDICCNTFNIKILGHDNIALHITYNMFVPPIIEITVISWHDIEKPKYLVLCAF